MGVDSNHGFKFQAVVPIFVKVDNSNKCQGYRTEYFGKSKYVILHTLLDVGASISLLNENTSKILGWAPIERNNLQINTVAGTQKYNSGTHELEIKLFDQVRTKYRMRIQTLDGLGSIPIQRVGTCSAFHNSYPLVGISQISLGQADQCWIWW